MTNDEIVAHIAGRNHGLCHRDQALGAGVTQHAWERIVRAPGFEELFPGIVRPVSVVIHPELIVRAAQRSVRGSMVSHETAQWLWTCDPPRRGRSRPAAEVALLDEVRPVHLTLLARGRAAERPGIVIHRPRNQLDLLARQVRGIDVTSPLRTLLDLGQTRPELVAPLFAEFVTRRLVAPTAVRDAITRHARRGRSGLDPLRSALGESPPDSVMEEVVQRLLHQHGLFGFVFHPQILGYTPDFADPVAKVVLEFDGFEDHGRRRAFEDDRLRDAELAANGWVTIRQTWLQVRHTPEAVGKRIARTVALRSAA